MTLSVQALPERPGLEQLRNQAKDLQRAFRSGRTEAVREVAARYGPVPGPALTRSVALLVVSCSWPVCRTKDDDPQDWRDAAELLARHPAITAGSVAVAAAAGDVPSLGRLLAADPAAAGRDTARSAGRRCSTWRLPGMTTGRACGAGGPAAAHCRR